MPTNMHLGDWSGRRVAGVWIVAAAIEVLVIAVAAMHPIVLETGLDGTSNVMLIRDSGAPRAGIANAVPHADSLSDSARALVGQLLADSLMQRAARSLVDAEREAARDAIILAAVILLPVPLAASVITTRWLWLRRTGSAPPQLNRPT